MKNLVIVAALVAAIPVSEVAASSARDVYRDGRAALERGDRSGAVRLFEQAVQLDPGSSRYHYWLGRAYGEEARHANVIRRAFYARRIVNAFEKAVELDSSNVDARIALVEFYSAAPAFLGGSADKAAEQVRAIRAVDPLRAHDAQARIYRRHGDDEAVQREYRAAAREFPDSAEPHLWLADFLSDKGRDHDAAAEYEAAERLQGGSQMASRR